MTRRDTLIEKYGSEEAYKAKLSEWGKAGAKTKTKEDLSKAGKKGYKVMKSKYTDKEWSQLKKEAINKRWVDSLSKPKNIKKEISQ